MVRTTIADFCRPIDWRGEYDAGKFGSWDFVGRAHCGRDGHYGGDCDVQDPEQCGADENIAGCCQRIAGNELL